MFEVPTADDPLDPYRLYERLRLECNDFSEWRDFEPDVAFLWRTGEWQRKGKSVLGSCGIPTVPGGDNRKLFEWMLDRILGRFPDFLITINKDWYEGAPPKSREALVFHEMLHIDVARNEYGEMRLTREGTPIWTVGGHDLEEFNAVVARYGAWSCDIAAFLDAARAGGAV